MQTEVFGRVYSYSSWKTLSAVVIVNCLHRAVTLSQDERKSQIESDSDVSLVKNWAEFIKKIIQY
jgi:hypothetical protein